MKEENIKNQEAEETMERAQEQQTETQQQTEEAPQPKTAEEVEAEWKDKYMRLQAEFENFRRRTVREKMDLVETGGQSVLMAILPVLDDMERAIAASEKSEDLEALRSGEKLVAQKFTDVLRQQKVTEIEAIGEPFNEELHEAIARFAAGEDKKGKVIDVAQKGYRLGEKVLRYAKVVVGE